jgi:hypothetical protein
VNTVQQISSVDGQQPEPLLWVALLQKLVDQFLGTIRVLQIQNDFFCCLHLITSHFHDTTENVKCEMLISNCLPCFT